MKKTVWAVGFLLMVLFLLLLGVDKLSSWLQFITSTGCVYGFGEWLEHKFVHLPKRQEILQQLHAKVDHLHEKHDALHEKLGGE